jgi:putative GTP pyrophosphokinase
MQNKISKEDFYRENLVLLEGVQIALISRIDIIRKYKTAQNMRDPVEHCKGRIKSPQSMIEKLKKLGFEPTVENAMTKVYDASGIRVVCSFIDDVYNLVYMIRQQNDIKIVSEKDYIKNPKPSGYRSYHLQIEMPITIGDKTHTVLAEIQIRTVIMDCWASLEHQLRYKHDISQFEFISGELKRCADELASTEINFQTMREMIQNIGDNT